MQSRIGKRGSIEGVGRARVPSFTGVQAVVAGLILLFNLTSCSHHSKSKQIDKEKPPTFSGLCLSGEGKGRVEHLDGRYVFSYENLFNTETKEWLIGLSLPMHGEEVLGIGFGKADESRVKINGKFIKRMVLAARKEGKSKEVAQLKKVLAKIAVFLKVVDLVRIGDQKCSSTVCKLGKHQFELTETNDELNAEFDFDKNHKLLINARAKSKFYRKINFILRDLRRSSDARQPFNLLLLPKECSEPL